MDYLQNCKHWALEARYQIQNLVGAKGMCEKTTGGISCHDS